MPYLWTAYGIYDCTNYIRTVRLDDTFQCSNEKDSSAYKYYKYHISHTDFAYISNLLSHYGTQEWIAYEGPHNNIPISGDETDEVYAITERSLQL